MGSERLTKSSALTKGPEPSLLQGDWDKLSSFISTPNNLYNANMASYKLGDANGINFNTDTMSYASVDGLDLSGNSFDDFFSIDPMEDFDPGFFEKGGMAGTLFDGLSTVAGLYIDWQNMNTAKDTLEFQQDAWSDQFAATQAEYHNQLDEREFGLQSFLGNPTDSESIDKVVADKYEKVT